MRSRRALSLRRPARVSCAALLACLALAATAATAAAAPEPPPSETRLVRAPGRIVPIPASIPHEAGDMVDRRILPDLRWIAKRYPIFVTDGYSGPLPGGRHAGCDECHVRNSDHYNGLAVDVVPLDPSPRCDAKWAAITRLALWAEPVQNEPLAPFRWIGYDGDAGHGCGHHLHLSWNHAPVRQFQLAEWVEVFATGEGPLTRKPRGKRVRKAPPKPAGPTGGVAQASTGGLGAR